MATKTQDWATVVTSTDPSGTVTIGTGTNRCLILVQGIQFNVDAFGSVSASCAVGGQAATGSGSLFYQDSGDRDGYVNYWYWNESALDAMSGNTISYNDDNTPTQQIFTYVTYSSVDQASPVAVFTAQTASADTFTVNTTSNADDNVNLVVYRQSQNRDFTDWDTLTEQIDYGTGILFRFGVADGAGGDNFTTITGDGINGAYLAASIVVKSLSGVGSGSLIAPLAVVSGSADVGINDLKPAAVTLSGVGVREVVWHGPVSLVAPNATSSVDAQAVPDSFNETDIFLKSILPTVGLSGTRTVQGTGSATNAASTLTGGAARNITAAVSISAQLPTIAGDNAYDALWYVAKSVYF